VSIAEDQEAPGFVTALALLASDLHGFARGLDGRAALPTTI